MPKSSLPSASAKKELVAHKARLADLRVAATARLERSTEEYGSLRDDGGDVGAGDDEGGGEADVTSAERDRLRAAISVDTQAVEAIDAAIARAETPGWATCVGCGGDIGAARLEAIPSTDRCVNCKATANAW